LTAALAVTILRPKSGPLWRRSCRDVGRHTSEGFDLGRKYHKRSYRRSSGLGSILLGALGGRRTSHYHPAPYRRSSFKSSILQAVLKAILKKIFR
jgi:hypothetical protein